MYKVPGPFPSNSLAFEPLVLGLVPPNFIAPSSISGAVFESSALSTFSAMGSFGSYVLVLAASICPPLNTLTDFTSHLHSIR
ncbi:MAG: hypothetical protein JKY53_00850 [Flavobacteriales bacterium]|nr:hypothetical protein [Flavobacteriales bacterium]